MTETEIPEDIMEDAGRCYRAFTGLSEYDIVYIAREILAERERCAKIADDYPKRDPGGDGNGYWAAEEIAAAIRAP